MGCFSGGNRQKNGFRKKKVPVWGVCGLFHRNWYFSWGNWDLQLAIRRCEMQFHPRALFRGKTAQGAAPCLVADPRVLLCLRWKARREPGRPGRGGVFVFVFVFVKLLCCSYCPLPAVCCVLRVAACCLLPAACCPLCAVCCVLPAATPKEIF